MPAPARTSPTYERLFAQPEIAVFRAGESAASLAVNREGGVITGVSLITAEREATGWFRWIDAKTVTMFAELLAGRSLKAYATHGSWGGDGTLDEVGLWKAARVDGKNLRADFNALQAWRKHSEDEFDTLFELAEKAPGEFGASLSFRHKLAWVRKNGEDVETRLAAWNWDSDAPIFEPAAPADAVRFDMPSVRPYKVMSADFVDEPAGNTGLFRAGEVDAAGKGVPPASETKPTAFAMIKEIYAKFSAQSALLTRAIALHTENDKLTFSEIVSKVEGEQKDSELTRLRGESTQLSAFTAALEKAGFKADGTKSALDALLESHAGFKAKATAHDTSEAALKAAGFEAKDGKTATELALASNKKLAGDIATLKAGGHPAVDTGAAKPDGGGGKAELKGLSRTVAAFKTKVESQKSGAN